MANDVRLSLSGPEYVDRSLVHPADFAYWEVVYDDGTVLVELDPGAYFNIERDRVKEFRIIHRGEIIATLFPNSVRGSTGQHLVFRRRTFMEQGGGRRVVLLAGFSPMGPVYSFDVDTMAYRVEDGFIENDPELYPPAAWPGEPEMTK